jgi:hypothetical protein
MSQTAHRREAEKLKCTAAISSVPSISGASNASTTFGANTPLETPGHKVRRWSFQPEGFGFESALAGLGHGMGKESGCLLRGVEASTILGLHKIRRPLGRSVQVPRFLQFHLGRPAFLCCFNRRDERDAGVLGLVKLFPRPILDVGYTIL